MDAASLGGAEQQPDQKPTAQCTRPQLGGKGGGRESAKAASLDRRVSFGYTSSHRTVHPPARGERSPVSACGIVGRKGGGATACAVRIAHRPDVTVWMLRSQLDRDPWVDPLRRQEWDL
jgi:hypothetical protein